MGTFKNLELKLSKAGALCARKGGSKVSFSVLGYTDSYEGYVPGIVASYMTNHTNLLKSGAFLVIYFIRDKSGDKEAHKQISLACKSSTS